MTSPSWAHTLCEPASIQQLPETTTWKMHDACRVGSQYGGGVL